MSQDDASSISVIAFRAERYSQDGKSIVISFWTKFPSAERKYLVPMECLRDFLVDLQRLDAIASADRDGGTTCLLSLTRHIGFLQLDDGVTQRFHPI
jgi:hypothetical protein